MKKVLFIILIFNLKISFAQIDKSYSKYGFNSEGKYIKFPPYDNYFEGDPFDSTFVYDPWGFDANGIHKDTDKDFNPFGYTQKQIFENSKLTVNIIPYYWIIKYKYYVKTDSLRFQFLKNNKLKINNFRDSLLKDIISELEIKIKEKRAISENLRNSIRGLIKKKNIDSFYVYGKDNKYFNEDLSLNFSQLPKKMIVPKSLNRDTLAIQLEYYHIELVKNDFYLLKIKDSLKINNDLLTLSNQSFFDFVKSEVVIKDNEEILYFEKNDQLFWEFLKNLLQNRFSFLYESWRLNNRIELDQLD